MKKNLLRIFYLLILLLTYNLASSQYKVPDYVQNWNSSEPTVLSQDIEGGAQQVANIAARDAIPEAKRKIGMIVSYELTGEWIAEMYIGTDVLNANWINPNNWQNIESDNPDVDTLKANVIVLGGSEPVDSIITIKDAVNAEQFDSIHVDTAHVDHELFVRDTAIVELIETYAGGLKSQTISSDIYIDADAASNYRSLYFGATEPFGNFNLRTTSGFSLMSTDISDANIYSQISGFIDAGEPTIEIYQETNSADHTALFTSEGFTSQNIDTDILNVANVTTIDEDSLTTDLKIVSKQYAGQLVVSTPLTLLLDVDDQFYTVTGLTSDIEENTTLTDSTITLGSESYGLYHFLITLTVEHTALNAEITCSVFLNDVETDATETQTVNGAGEPFGYSIQGLAWLSPGDVIKVRFASSNNGTLTVNRGNYHVIRN